MALSSDLTSLFVKTTKDNKNTKNESTVYGTVVKQGNEAWVQLDGSDLLTPFTTTTDVKDGERVMVTIKNHTATVTGNTTEPSGRHSDVVDVQDRVSAIEADYINTEKLVANTAEINNLIAKKATVEDLEATNAKITTLEAEDATIKKLVAENAEFTNAKIENLEAENLKINNLIGGKASFEDLEAERARIDDLAATKADITFANVDFANIDKAKFGEFYAQSGIIEDYTAENGTVTGKLVAVSIDADNITTGSLLAERIMLQGDDGLFYKLNVDAMGKTAAEELPAEEQEKLKNGIHGKSIIAESITADKIKVSDLTAFGATIGGLKIEGGSIHSSTKNTIDNTTEGIYLDSKGQMNVGDQHSYIKYYETDTGEYKLEIFANSITLGTHNKSIDEFIDEELAKIDVGARNLIRHSDSLIFEDYYFSGPFVAVYDGVSDIEITCGAIASVSENDNINLRTLAIVTDDSNGNVSIS